MHTSKNGRYSKISQNSKVRMSEHVDTSSTVVPLERNLHGPPLAGLLWERHFEEVLMKLDWECLFVGRKTRMILIGIRG